MRKLLKALSLIVILAAMCMLMTGCWGKEDNTDEPEMSGVNEQNNPANPEELEEPEENTVFESEQGYQIEYNSNRFVVRQSEGYDYFIGLEGADKLENEDIFFAVAVVAPENVEAVRASIFPEEKSSGECILSQGTLRGRFTAENGYADSGLVGRRTFMVDLNDETGRALVIETQFPIGKNEVWEKVRFDHMLNTISEFH